MILLKEKQIRVRAKIKVDRISSLLKSTDRIIDIGCGNGGVCKLLQEKDFYLTALDIKNKSCFTDIQPVIFDGDKIPFTDKSFDVAMLITVLHHTKNPEELIREAVRVAQKVIIMEDVYTNPFQKYLTFFTDSLVNWEWFAHPHSNKSDKEWKLVFEKSGLKLEKQIDYPKFLFLFKQVTYVVTGLR